MTLICVKKQTTLLDISWSISRIATRQINKHDQVLNPVSQSGVFEVKYARYVIVLSKYQVLIVKITMYEVSGF